MTSESLAMEEWKQLHSIVGRLETLVFQNRGWLLLLLGGLVAALYAERRLLTGRLFALVGTLLVLLFCWTELVLRVPMRRAIHR